MTRLTPDQVQEIEERWHFSSHAMVLDLARLIASHRAVEQEQDKLADGLSISEGLRKWSMQQLEQSQDEATRLRTALEKAPWVSDRDGVAVCCWCGGYRDDGHKATCFIQQALTGQEAQDE